MKLFVKMFLVLLVICCAVYLFVVFPKKPSHDRAWTPDQERLAQVDISGDLIHIDNVRDIFYRSVDDYDVSYISKDVDINNLVSIDFMVEPFSDIKGPAHTFLSFGFETDDGVVDYIVVSVEIRKEIGEHFSPWKGLWRNYELVYVIGTEDDLIRLRTNHRKDHVYLYPIKTTQTRMQAMFLSMMRRTHNIYETPEFYNTLTNTCTTNIVDHVNELVPDRVPFSFKILLPAYADELAYDLGLIDTDLSFESAQEKYRIDDLAQAHGDEPGFSGAIRVRR